MAYSLLTNSQLNEILKSVGEKLKLLHQKRIREQKEVFGSSFPTLKQKTIERKRKKGGGISANAEKRLIETGDFMRHAFVYDVKGNVLTFGISNQPHKFVKTWEARQRELKRGAKKFTQHKPFSYRDLAGWQLSKKSLYAKGSFPKKGISPNNAGADFFGMNKFESDELFKYMQSKAVRYTQDNIKNALKEMISKYS